MSILPPAILSRATNSYACANSLTSDPEPVNSLYRIWGSILVSSAQVFRWKSLLLMGWYSNLAKIYLWGVSQILSMAKFFKKLILLLITSMLTLILLHQLLDNFQLKKQNEVKNVIEQHNIKRQYRVLLWTKWYAFKWTKFLPKHPNCSVTNCLFTDDRTDISSYDAIAFHWFNIQPRDLPKEVLDRQKWILYTRESPHYITSSLLSTGLKKIDWMMTYRTGSEVYTPFGSVFKCDTNWKPKYSFEDKRKSIAWFVSHCHTKSKRETYVKKLQEYIDVDIYGWCGPFKCKKNDKTCDEMVSKQYKFYLAFENSVSFVI